ADRRSAAPAGTGGAEPSTRADAHTGAHGCELSRALQRARRCGTGGVRLRFALFYHSLISDWNNGNAHFLRGVASELIARRHDVRVFEPANAWSVQNLVADHGEAAIAAFHA